VIISGSFFRNITNGKSYIVTEDLTRELLIDEMNTWIYLIFEKSQRSIGIKKLPYRDKISGCNGEDIKELSFKLLPILNRTAMNLLYMISNTGLPASFYLYSKENFVKEMVKKIEIGKQK